jgi:hypothetical protein
LAQGIYDHGEPGRETVKPVLLAEGRDAFPTAFHSLTAFCHRLSIGPDAVLPLASTSIYINVRRAVIPSLPHFSSRFRNKT